VLSEVEAAAELAEKGNGERKPQRHRGTEGVWQSVITRRPQADVVISVWNGSPYV